MARRRERRGGEARGGVFHPVNMVIANPSRCKKESLIGGSNNNRVVETPTPSPDNSHPDQSINP